MIGDSNRTISALTYPKLCEKWAATADDDAQFLASRLSERESEVFSLYASGVTGEMGGRRLYISGLTVNGHLKRIRDKYADASRPARTKHELFLRAVEDGLIEWSALRSPRAYPIRQFKNQSVSLHNGDGYFEANALPIMPGWNHVLRLYHPQTSVLDGAWVAPRPEALEGA